LINDCIRSNYPFKRPWRCASRGGYPSGRWYPRNLFFNSSAEILESSIPGKGELSYEVRYDIPGRGEVTEVTLHRVTNGLSANYAEPYMRRRDPETMLIGDSKPTDKKRFEEVYGYPFDQLRSETLGWLEGQELGFFSVLQATGQ
jgi:hypothetical protein